MFRSLWVILVGLTATPFLASRVLWANWFRPREQAICVCDHLAGVWGRLMIRASGSRVTVEGSDHLAADQPHIIVSNHASWFDVFAMIGYLPGRCRFVAKKELARIPIFGSAWLACGHVSIDREDRAAAITSLEEAAERVRSERLNIVIFPEGTRTATGEIGPFKKGAFVLAIQAGVPVVPAGLVGSREVLPKGSWRTRPGHIRIRLGSPIPVESFTHADRERLRVRVREAVDALVPGAATDHERDRTLETGGAPPRVDP